MQASQIQPRIHRSFQFALFAASITWVFAAMGLATKAARGLAIRFQLNDEFMLLDAILLVFLLLVGFGVLQGIAVRNSPLRRTLGLPKRPTAGSEWATGAAIGWAVVVLAVLPMALGGTLRLRLWIDGRSLWLVVLDVGTIAVLALASEIAFRGYPFQKLIETIGPGWATFVISLLFGVVSTFNQESTYLSTIIAILFGVVLCLAWLRTHGLWLSWGLHFAWIASMGILFGLPVGGVDNLSSIVQTRVIGPGWLTGGEFGVEGALLTPLLLLAAIVVLVRLSSDWAWDYARKPLIPAGYAMDVAPPAEHAAMEAQAAKAPPPLVQILPTTPQSRSVQSEE